MSTSEDDVIRGFFVKGAKPLILNQARSGSKPSMSECGPGLIKLLGDSSMDVKVDTVKAIKVRLVQCNENICNAMLTLYAFAYSCSCNGQAIAKADPKIFGGAALPKILTRMATAEKVPSLCITSCICRCALINGMG